ncbi:hypothetical protein ACJMK2_025555, partial [Sinanodonta woodiana]
TMELNKGNLHENCSVHGGRRKEFYCADHDAFYCSICVFKLHKDCSSILAPDEVETFITEFKVLMDSDIKRLQKEVSKLFNEKMSAYDRVVSTKTKTEADIKTLRDAIDKQLNRLQKNTTTTMNYALKQELPKYRNQIEDLRSIQNDLSDSAGLFSKAALNDQNDSTVEQMRSLILQKKRLQEINTKIKTRDEREAISKQVVFKVSAQVQEVLKTLSKLEQLGTISICHVAKSKEDTKVTTLSNEAEEAKFEVVMNPNCTCTNDADNALNNVNHGEGDIETCMATKESKLYSKHNAVDSVAVGSMPHLGQNQCKCIESNFSDGLETKNASVVTVGTLKLHQIYDEELRIKMKKDDEIDSEIHPTGLDTSSEASEGLLPLGERRGNNTGSQFDVTGEHNNATLAPVATPSEPTPYADENIINISDNTHVEEEETMGCFSLRQKLYTIVGRGDRSVGNLNTKRSRSLPVFHSRTRRQNKDVVVIEDDGSVHILMTD